MRRTIAVTLAVLLAGAGLAQETAPKPRPARPPAAAGMSADAPALTPEPAPAAGRLPNPAADPLPSSVPDRAADAPDAPEGPLASPGRGSVTNLPLPRFVSLKGTEGNARRGPGLTHRIDWVFTRRDMPLQVTAEFENWRRVQDQDGLGGWIHYSLLSGTRSVLTLAQSPLTASPAAGAPVTAVLEAGVVARVSQCAPDWCRVTVAGQRGWLPKTALWGVAAGELLD